MTRGTGPGQNIWARVQGDKNVEVRERAEDIPNIVHAAHAMTDGPRGMAVHPSGDRVRGVGRCEGEQGEARG